MKAIIKLCEIIVILATLYLSGWMLIGGIIQTVNAINPFIAKEIIIGVIKIIFCEIPILLGCIFVYSAEEYLFWKI